MRLAVNTLDNLVAWPLVAVSGRQAVETALWCRLRTEIGTWPNDESVGLPLLRWLASPRVRGPEVAALIRLQAEALDGLTVVSCAATVDASGITFRLQYEYDDGGEAATGEAGGTLYAVDGLPAWYVLAGGC